MEERKVDADAVIARLRPKLAGLFRAPLCFYSQFQDVRVGGLFHEFSISIYPPG